MRAIASLTLSFGLVSIPVKLYSATESSAAIRFKLMSRGGARLRQHYVADEAPAEPEELEAPAPEAPRLRAAPTPLPVARDRGRRVQPAAREEPPEEEPDEPPPRPIYIERQDMVK